MLSFQNSGRLEKCPDSNNNGLEGFCEQQRSCVWPERSRRFSALKMRELCDAFALTFILCLCI